MPEKELHLCGMDKEQMNYLKELVGEEKFDVYMGIPDGYNLYLGDYQDLETDLMENPDRSYFYPLSSISFDRSDHVQLTCVQERLDFGFYLLNKTDVKNLAFLDNSHTVYYNHDLVADYMKEINPEVSLKKVDVIELEKQDLAIHFGTFWAITSLQALSQEEFVPFPGAGLLVGVCHRENLKVRKRMTRFHSAETYDLSNIQRGIQLKWPEEDDLIYLSSYARRDVQSNIHCTVAYLKKHVLQYVHHSQSTSFNLVEEILEKL